MAQALVIVLFVVLHLHESLRGAWNDAPHPNVVWWVLAGTLAASAFMHAFALLCGRAMDRRGSLRAAGLADAVALAVRLGSALALATAILAFGWLDLVREFIGNTILLDELAAIAPAIVVLVASWWSLEPIERRLREAVLWRDLHEPTGAAIHAPPSRGMAVWNHTRHALLIVLVPLAAILAWGESLDRLLPFLAQRWGSVPGWADTAARFAGVLAVVLLTPLAIRVLWSTVAIGPGSLRDQALAVAHRHGVRVRGPLLWRTGGAVVNAAILGIIYPLRYMLFTDALLERLSREQVEGVIAHEIAHVKLRHMAWLAATVLASALALGWVLEGAAFIVGRSPVADLAGTAAGLSATLLLFGLVSRRFEWQADAFALRHLSGDAPTATREAAETMAGALQSVAVLNGLSTRRFGFRHGSIADRQRRLRALAGVDAHRFPIDRQVRVVKVVVFVVLSASLAGLVLVAWT